MANRSKKYIFFSNSKRKRVETEKKLEGCMNLLTPPPPPPFPVPPRSGVLVQPPRRSHGQEGGPQPSPRRGGHQFRSPSDQVRLWVRRSNKLHLCLFLPSSLGAPVQPFSFGTRDWTASHLEQRLTDLFPPLRLPPSLPPSLQRPP